MLRSDGLQKFILENVISFAFLNYRPKQSFWLGTLIALVGMVVFIGPETILTLKLDQAFLMRVSRSVLTSLLILGYLHSDLNPEIITISNFLKSKISLKKNSLLPEMSSISIKYHFFLAL